MEELALSYFGRGRRTLTFFVLPRQATKRMAQGRGGIGWLGRGVGWGLLRWEAEGPNCSPLSPAHPFPLPGICAARAAMTGRQGPRSSPGTTARLWTLPACSASCGERGRATFDSQSTPLCVVAVFLGDEAVASSRAQEETIGPTFGTTNGAEALQSCCNGGF